MLRTMIVALGLLWAGHAFALALDVGMLTQVTGKVEITSVGGEKHAAVSFLKVAVGDKLVLSQDAQVQVVYFDSSHQELWKGAGQVEIGASDGHSQTIQPVIKKLPPLVARQLIKTPASGEQGTTGMVTVRSLSSDTIESLEKQYQEFKSTTTADDTTPEVFLMTGLLEMKEYEHATTVLDGFRAKLTSNPQLAAVVDHFEPLVKAGAAEQ